MITWHGVVCSTDGDAPFYDLCPFGRSQDIRGYQIGQYRDERMVAAQAEWRSEIWWRFGGVVFAEADVVGHRAGEEDGLL